MLFMVIAVFRRNVQCTHQMLNPRLYYFGQSFDQELFLGAPATRISHIDAGLSNGGSGYPLHGGRFFPGDVACNVSTTAAISLLSLAQPRHARMAPKKERLPAILPGAVALHSLVKKRKQTHDAYVSINNIWLLFLVRGAYVKFSIRRANSSRPIAEVELLTLYRPREVLLRAQRPARARFYLVRTILRVPPAL
jgi:hypothetical protein